MILIVSLLLPNNSFIRLCDYLVVTMLHNLTVASASAVLEVLQQQTAKEATITDLVKDIPDDIEEQERMLQVHYMCMYMYIVNIHIHCTCMHVCPTHSVCNSQDHTVVC